MINLTIALRGAEKLINALKSKDTINKPLENGIKRIALYFENLVKKATVVDTGRLRSSITSRIGQQEAKIGTNVEYAQFVEYGHMTRGGRGFVPARHMEGGMKILGKGMFTYALELLKSWLDKDEHGIHKDIEARFE